MGEFSAEWLALREPADHGARSVRLTRAIAERIAASKRRPRIVDLAAGAGSNMRYLAPYLPPRQHWRLIDHDATLLRVASRTRDANVATIAAERFDLSTLDAPSAHELFDGASLVTASALLDLVSERFVRVVVAACRGAGAAVLFALTYDGRIACTPEDSGDAEVRDLVNRHQRDDKGFGPALGPAAADEAVGQFAAAGFDVDRDRSDWRLAAGDGELQRALIDGWATAAIDMAPDRAAIVDGWRARRLAHVDGGTSIIVVGHEDIAGFPNSSFLAAFGSAGL